MKSIKTLALILLSLSSLLISCSHDKNQDLAKTWQVSDIKTPTKIPDSLKTAILQNSTMQFTDDGHYTSSGGIGADQGTYTLDEKGKTLSTISSAGRNSDVYTIKELDDDELILKRGETTITCRIVKQ